MPTAYALSLSKKKVLMAISSKRAVPCVLTIDIGSSSIRVLAFDAQAQRLEGIENRAELQLHTTADGGSEVDADQLFAIICRCIDQALEQLGSAAYALRAVAVDSFVSNMLGVDQAGRPITPVYTYADTRNSQDSELLRQQLDEYAVHQRTGCLLRSSYWPARLAWLGRTQAQTWDAVAHWITIGEYLERRILGVARVGYSPASWSGLLDRQKLCWDAELLDALGLDEARLSPLVDTRLAAYGLTTAYAERWPALAQVAWFPALGDGAAANIGSSCHHENHVALTVGTTGALRIVRAQVDQVPAGLWCYRIDGRRALLGGATSEGGNVFAWLQRTLQIGDLAALEKTLATRIPDGHGLDVLPLWAGERSPGWAGNARASIVGMTLGTAPIDIVQAALEAVAYRFAIIAEQLIPAEHEATLIASGGALQHSPVWTQMIADAIGHPILMSQEAEATSRGSAILALESLGMIASLDDLAQAEGQIFHPDTQRNLIYKAAIERQRRLYDKLIKNND